MAVAFCHLHSPPVLSESKSARKGMDAVYGGDFYLGVREYKSSNPKATVKGSAASILATGRTRR